MTIYKNNIPQPTDNLDISQADLLNNFTQLDLSFAVDHYEYSDGTADNGKHKVITLPEQAAEPATAVDENKIYVMEKLAAIGPQAYVRGESSAVTTPLTSIHAVTTAFDAAGAHSEDIIDLNGLTRAIIQVSACKNNAGARSNVSSEGIIYYYDDGTGGHFMNASTDSTFGNLSGGGAGTLVWRHDNGSILSLFSNAGSLSQVMYTLNFLRIE